MNTGLYITTPKDAPVDVSWWLIRQSAADQSSWYNRARAEVDRMAGSREARKMWSRPSVDEIQTGGKRGA